MTGDRRLGDFVKSGDFADLKITIDGMEAMILKAAEWIRSNTERTQRTLVFYNFLGSIKGYLHVLELSIDEHISMLALATRNLYEINVQLHRLISDEAQIESWSSEAITDKIQMLEGILGVSTQSEMKNERMLLENEISRMKALRIKYSLPEVKSPPPIGQLVGAVGLGDEHKNLFKLFSKLLHPSSMLVNDYANSSSFELVAILQLHAQLYAWDSFLKICEIFSVPENLRNVQGNT